MNPISLHKKLFQVYALQAVLISAATVLSVLIAAYVLEHLLIHKALEQEAQHYWSLSIDAPHALPNTRNLRGFLEDAPAELKLLTPGYGRIAWQDQQAIYYVSDHGQQRLYLLFLQKNVTKLALYFGVLPLSLLLFIFYIFMWFSYQQSKRALSPLTQLATRVSEYRFTENTLPKIQLQDLKHQADIEALSLIRALELFNQQLCDYIDRERHFSRDASHELRTPLALLQASLDVIEQDAKLHPQSLKTQHHLQKMQNTIRSMLSLLEALLLLARDAGYRLPTQPVAVNPLIHAWQQRNQREITQKKLHIDIIENSFVSLIAPPSVLQMVLENLLNNALKYTQQGKIQITVQAQQVQIHDTGSGISSEDLPQIFAPFYRGSSENAPSGTTNVSGFGLGLSIVKRLCDQFGWQIIIQSDYGKGTQVTLLFVSGTPISKGSLS
jgi:hypothetical protein